MSRSYRPSQLQSSNIMREIAARAEKISVRQNVLLQQRRYSTSDNNEKLFQNILRVPSNLMLQGFCSMIFCLGSPNSGKTYSLAGKTIHTYEQQAQPGIIIYMMRRLFSKFKHEDSLYSTYSFWCKFLFIQRDRIYNLSGNLTQKDWINNNNNTKILIKNYSHFQQLIGQVYSNNSNKCHTIIELILQKQTPNQQPTTSSLTFIEFGSFFYNCPYREAEQLSMENDIQSTLLTIKNLSKAKQNLATTNIFDSSMLTKLLKNSFLKACSFQFIGILDDSYQNNLKTLNFLDIIMHKKQNYGYNKNVKEQIKRQQIYLKSLYEKHRRVLNLLSRCIGMQLGFLQKQKKKKNFDGPILNTFYKTCQKIKYANLKKFQNQKVLEQIRKNIQKQKAQLNEIEAQYQQKFKKLQQQRIQLILKRNQLQEAYDNIVNPSVKFGSVDNSLYCRYEDEQKSVKKFTSQQQQLGFPNSNIDSQRQSKNDGKSFRMYPSTLQITTKKNITSKFDNMVQRDKQNQKYQRNIQQQQNILKERRIRQIKKQIGLLFKLILHQQFEIQEKKKKLPLHYNQLLNKVKNKNQTLQFDIKQAKQCFLNNQKNNIFPYEYNSMLQNMIAYQKFQKQLLASNHNSLGAISMKSLRSQKQFRIL